jgi:hypothetical protein
MSSLSQTQVGIGREEERRDEKEHWKTTPWQMLYSYAFPRSCVVALFPLQHELIVPLKEEEEGKKEMTKD